MINTQDKKDETKQETAKTDEEIKKTDGADKETAYEVGQKDAK